MFLHRLKTFHALCGIAFLLTVSACSSGGGGSSGGSISGSSSSGSSSSSSSSSSGLAVGACAVEIEPIEAEQAVAQMGMGINLGNTFDAPNEGEWAPAAQQVFFEDFAEAGFKHVRIPVTWGGHVQTVPPYAINAEFLQRVEDVVDWALAQDMYVVLNAHHETWLKQGYDNAANRDRFDAVWRQVAARFCDKPAKLVFEILNEPVDMTLPQVNQLNARILPIIRQQNPNRLVVFSGNGFTPVDALVEAAVPDDDYLIGNFHSYDPWPFAGQCTRAWGSQADINALTAIYDKAADWSARNGIPVTVNEFGVAHYDFTQPENVCDLPSRLSYLQTHVELARERGIAATVWDDAGSFQVYDRGQGSWGPEKDVLVGTD